MLQDWKIPPVYKNLYKNDESLVVRRGKTEFDLVSDAPMDWSDSLLQHLDARARCRHDPLSDKYYQLIEKQFHGLNIRCVVDLILAGFHLRQAKRKTNHLILNHLILQ